MEVSLIAKCLREIEDQFYVKIVDDMALLTKVYELRYQVYCTERGFEKGTQQPGQAGMESDDFDVRSRHIALIDRHTSQLVGTARMVQSVPASACSGFPMQTVCNPSLFEKFPLDTTVEISRFAISKQRRSATSAALMRMGLIRGLVRLSAELGVTHWCAVMEPTLLRLLSMTAIYFEPLGPAVEYHGLRQPCFSRLDRLLERVKQGRPEIWNYLTEGGEIWPRHAEPLFQQEFDRHLQFAF